MAFAIVIFLFYTALFLFVLYKSTFVIKSNIGFKYIALFFIVKLIAGCFYGYIHYNSTYGASTDTWKFYYQSLTETALLKQNPFAFLQHVFGNGYSNGGGGVLVTTNSYWNDLKHNIMLFIMSICNLFTCNNYYANVVIYNGFTFFGLIAFYRFCMHYFTMPQKILQIVVFCVPSFTFWTSGFHKEGIIFTAIAFIFYSAMQLLHNKKIILHTISIFIALVIIFLLRNYILLFLLPILVAWAFLLKFNLKYKLALYFTVSAAIVLLFFNGKLIHKKLDLTQYATNAQNDFLKLKASTKLNVDTLQPTAKSFAANSLTAFKTGFLQPSISSIKITYLPALLDNVLIAILILINIFYIKNAQKLNVTSLLFFSVTLMVFLFLGFTVPIVGAIIRYKVLFMPLLYIALMQRIELLTQKFKLN